MARYFLDTSALVKRYVGETGHSWVYGICKPSRGHWLYMSEAALVEVTATLCRMVRENPPRLTLANRDRLLALFQRHVHQNYHIILTGREQYTRAASLCRVHPLRAYDAVQLACAPATRDDARAAAAEGLAVENPNDHP